MLINKCMPTYRYRCEQGHEFDYEQRISEPPLKFCPICAGEPQELIDANLSANGTSSSRNGAKHSKTLTQPRETNTTSGKDSKKRTQATKRVKVERLITQSGFILKGSGWAKDGYATVKQEPCSSGASEGGCVGGACSVATKTD